MSQPVIEFPGAIQQRLEQVTPVLVRRAWEGGVAHMLRPCLEIGRLRSLFATDPRKHFLSRIDESEQHFAATYAD